MEKKPADTWIYYFADGQEKQILHYENGKLNGLEQVFYQNGNIKSEKTFQNDLIIGISVKSELRLFNKKGSPRQFSKTTPFESKSRVPIPAFSILPGVFRSESFFTYQSFWCWSWFKPPHHAQ